LNLLGNFSAKSPVLFVAYGRELFKKPIQAIPSEEFD
jgi:hypothetical protein